MKHYDQHLVVGFGEIGEAISNVFGRIARMVIVDKKFNGGQPSSLDTDIKIMHICFPYTKNFIKNVKRYQKEYDPEFTVIHSTVPVGTTRKLKALHSPVIGIHPHLEQSLKTFTKFIAGEQASEVADYFRKAGMKVYLFDNQETTELMKILDTTFYGVCVEYAKEVKRITEDNNIPFEAWTLWTENYNKGYKELGYEEYTRPNLVPIMKKVGGHCVLPNAHLIDTKFTKFLRELNEE